MSILTSTRSSYARAFSMRPSDYRMQLPCLEARRWASAAGSAFFSGSFARLELASRSKFYLLQSFSSDVFQQASCFDVAAGHGKRNETICWLEAEATKVHHHPASPRLTLPRSSATFPRDAVFSVDQAIIEGKTLEAQPPPFEEKTVHCVPWRQADS